MGFASKSASLSGGLLMALNLYISSTGWIFSLYIFLSPSTALKYTACLAASSFPDDENQPISCSATPYKQHASTGGARRSG